MMHTGRASSPAKERFHAIIGGTGARCPEANILFSTIAGGNTIFILESIICKRIGGGSVTRVNHTYLAKHYSESPQQTLPPPAPCAPTEALPCKKTLTVGDNVILTENDGNDSKFDYGVNHAPRTVYPQMGFF